jgi:hypothetical protein
VAQIADFASARLITKWIFLDPAGTMRSVVGPLRDLEHCLRAVSVRRRHPPLEPSFQQVPRMNLSISPVIPSLQLPYSAGNR